MRIMLTSCGLETEQIVEHSLKMPGKKPVDEKGRGIMKRLLGLLFALTLFIGTAAAERTVVTALAAEVNPDNLVSVAADAKVLSCADGQFTITILVPERYDPEEINALKVGDAIWTEGREVEIRSITERDGYIVLNADTDDDDGLS